MAATRIVGSTYFESMIRILVILSIRLEALRFSSTLVVRNRIFDNNISMK